MAVALRQAMAAWARMLATSRREILMPCWILSQGEERILARV